MRARTHIIFFLALLTGSIFIFSRCTDFIARVDRQDQWKTLDSGKICLYYRAEGFSSSPSPGAAVAQQIVQNQNLYYQAILDTLEEDFSDKVLIYLYNEDEAEELTGTNTGGHAIPKYNAYYYTYLFDRRPFTDQYEVDNPVIGAHELVHVITHRVLGYPGTKLMSEGYAVWLDGMYAGYSIDDIIRKYRDEEKEKLMVPDELLNERVDKESVYYPNAGMLVRFLAHYYGVVNINRIFSSSRADLKEHFRQVTGESWENMSRRYGQYINEL